MNVLALSYLFPNPQQRDYGIFVYHRLRAVQEHCNIRVIAPLQWYPLRDKLHPKLAGTKAVPRKADFDGIETWYPRFPVVPRYLKAFDAFSYYCAINPVVSNLVADGFQFDLIDTHWTYPDILAAYLLSLQYKKPFIVTIRGREALYPGERGGRKRILDYCLRRADGVIALSSALAEEVVRIGVAEQKVRVILNGVHSSNFRPIDRDEARRKLGLDGQKKILLSVGRLTETKGHQHIIEALPSLSSLYDVDLHIIGGTNPETDFRRNLEKLVERHHLSNVYIHNGVQQDRLCYWYNAADIFCLASHGEGCPNVVLEAMACGTPAVVTDVGAVGDIIANESYGVIAKDTGVYAEALRHALSLPWDRDTVAQRMSAMSWRACASRVVEFSHSVMHEYCNV